MLQKYKQIQEKLADLRKEEETVLKKCDEKGEKSGADEKVKEAASRKTDSKNDKDESEHWTIQLGMYTGPNKKKYLCLG